jgi:hypothetical protein
VPLGVPQNGELSGVRRVDGRRKHPVQEMRVEAAMKARAAFGNVNAIA